MAKNRIVGTDPHEMAEKDLFSSLITGIAACKLVSTFIICLSLLIYIHIEDVSIYLYFLIVIAALLFVVPRPS